MNIDAIEKILSEAKNNLPIDRVIVSQEILNEIKEIVSSENNSFQLGMIPVILDKHMPNPPGFILIDHKENMIVPSKDGFIKIDSIKLNLDRF